MPQCVRCNSAMMSAFYRYRRQYSAQYRQPTVCVIGWRTVIFEYLYSALLAVVVFALAKRTISALCIASPSPLIIRLQPFLKIKYYCHTKKIEYACVLIPLSDADTDGVLSYREWWRPTRVQEPLYRGDYMGFVHIVDQITSKGTGYKKHFTQHIQRV